MLSAREQLQRSDAASPPLLSPCGMQPEPDAAAMIPIAFTVKGVPGQMRMRIADLAHWEESMRYRIVAATYLHELGAFTSVPREAFNRFDWRMDTVYELEVEALDAMLPPNIMPPTPRGHSGRSSFAHQPQLHQQPQQQQQQQQPPPPRERGFWSFLFSGDDEIPPADDPGPSLPPPKERYGSRGVEVSMNEDALRVLQETVAHLQSEIRSMRADTLPSTAITTATRALRRVEGMEARAADEARRVDAELAAFRTSLEERSAALVERERRLAAVEHTLLELREHMRQRVESEDAARAAAAASRAAEEAAGLRGKLEGMERVLEAARAEQARAQEASAQVAAMQQAALEATKQQLQRALQEHGAAAVVEIDGVKKHVLELAKGAAEAEEAAGARLARLEESMNLPAECRLTLDSLEAKLVDLTERQRTMLGSLHELIEQAIQSRVREVGAAAGRSVEEALAGIQQRVAALEENARAQRSLIEEAPSRLRAVASRLSESDGGAEAGQVRARIEALAAQQEKLRKEVSREEESSERRIAGVIDELSRASLSIKRIERLIAAQETDKLRVDELNRKILAELEDALWRIDELEEKVGCARSDADESGGPEGAPARPSSSAAAAAGPSASPQHASRRSTPSRGSEGPMALQRAVASLASRNVHVREIAEAVARLAAAVAPRPAAAAEDDATRAELRAVAAALVELFAKGAKKQKTGFFSFGSSEPYHPWDAFEAFASAHPLKEGDDSRPLPTFLYTAVEANARINPGSYAVARSASPWGLKDAKFHSLLRAAMNCRSLHAAFRELFASGGAVLGCLYDEWAPAMHNQTQKDLVVALEPLAAVTCEYSIDLLMTSETPSPAPSARGSAQNSALSSPRPALRK